MNDANVGQVTYLIAHRRVEPAFPLAVLTVSADGEGYDFAWQQALNLWYSLNIAVQPLPGRVLDDGVNWDGCCILGVYELIDGDLDRRVLRDEISYITHEF